MRANSLTHFLRYGSLVDQPEQTVVRHDTSGRELAREYNVLFPTGNVFRNSEIMWIQTQPQSSPSNIDPSPTGC